ncbi:MAG: DUF429 domain-containing protein [Thermomicrobiales bacterium]
MDDVPVPVPGAGTTTPGEPPDTAGDDPALATVTRTVGIDLASQANTTAGCVVSWSGTTATVEHLWVGMDDAAVLTMVGECDTVGIDAPFGWPRPFARFVADQAMGQPETVPWSPARRDDLRFRRTDVVVRVALGRWPLSVSSDLIAITAMRCAGLLAAMNVEDRSGAGRVVEVYPAVALRQWGFRSTGYKGIAGRATALPELVGCLRSRCGWLDIPESFARLCATSDHAFDALVCALVARAAAVGATGQPEDGEEREHARVEGWIAIPAADVLGRLARPSPGGDRAG